ncbi:MAG: hypothetical protein JXR25_01490 [Pontiellaceae bacterium]|nr:hypothetical protein [Pontiellaceae bacterium]MBN2783472.1 hypothetical protein [Pontiellaceae bacterium]
MMGKIGATLVVLLGFVSLGLSDTRLIDDFESYSQGEVWLETEDWLVTASQEIPLIVSDGANQYQETSGSVISLGDAQMDAGTTGEVFFRISVESGRTLDCSIGLADVAADQCTATWVDFEAYIAVVGSGPTYSLRARSGNSNVSLATINADTWYNIWLDVNLASSTYAVYYSTGSANIGAKGSATKLADNLSFRKGSGNALQTFKVHGSEGTDPKHAVFLDDISVAFNDIIPAITVSRSPETSGVVPSPTIQAVFKNGQPQQINPNVLNMTLNGVALNPSFTTDDKGQTTVKALAGSYLPSGSSNLVQLVVGTVNPNGLITNEWSFVVQDYETLPARYAYDLGLTNQSDRGFWYRDVGHSTLGNVPGSISRAIAQMALKAPYDVDDTSGAEPSGGYFLLPGDSLNTDVINFNILTTVSNTMGRGNFYISTNLPTAYNIVESLYPGITSSGGINDFSCETLGFLELYPGVYTFGVRHDDGFVFYMGD